LLELSRAVEGVPPGYQSIAPAPRIFPTRRAFVDIHGNPSDYRRVVGMLVSIASVATILVADPVFAQSASPGSAGGDLGRPGHSERVVRIGIGSIGPLTLSADFRTKLEDAAAAGLVASGATVVLAADISRARRTAGLGSCADSLCETRLARITDTHYWLRGAVQVEGSTYRIHLELLDAQTGSVAVARDDTCDICTEADAADLANVAASALKVTLTHTHVASAPAPAAAPVPAKPNPAPTSGPVLPALIDQQSAPPQSTLPAWRRWLAWAAFGGAVAAVASGIFYVSKDGQKTGCENRMIGASNMDICADVYDTMRPGVALIGVGAVLATSGILLLTLPTGKTDSSTRAKAKPNSSSMESVGSSRPSAMAAPHAQLVISLGSLAITGSF
jgi:hypothetical protein